MATKHVVPSSLPGSGAGEAASFVPGDPFLLPAPELAVGAPQCETSRRVTKQLISAGESCGGHTFMFTWDDVT